MKDIQKFLEIINLKNIPEFYSKYNVIHETKLLRLLHFGCGDGNKVLIIPPQAGHHSCIADYNDKQSLVQTLLQKGQDVYCVEWLSATQETKSTSISDIIEAIRECAEILEKSHIIGLCAGGWQATLCVAKYQELFTELTIAGSPIDAHASKEKSCIQDIISFMPQYVYEYLVSSNNGIMSGDMMLFGWKLGNFIDRYITDYLIIWNSLDDKQNLDGIIKFRTWYEYTQDLAGTWYLDAVDNLFRKNKLIKDELVPGVHLKNITCKVNMIAGDKDDITPPGQCFALEEYINDACITKKILIPNCGHIGIFMGRKAQKYWKDIF